ncbi:unnamed protein product [Camellia sinensis]
MNALLYESACVYMRVKRLGNAQFGSENPCAYTEWMARVIEKVNATITVPAAASL